MDTDPKKLGLLAESLTQDEYHLVDIHEADDQSTHVLHVERVEKHTPQTLHARNIQLGKIAEAFGVNSYDGMDVGPVPKQ